MIDSFEKYAEFYGFVLTDKRIELLCNSSGYYPGSSVLNESLTGKQSGFFREGETYEAAIMVNYNNVERVIIKGTSFLSDLWFHNMYNINDVQNKNLHVFKITNYSPISKFPRLNKRFKAGLIVGKRYGI